MSKLDEWRKVTDAAPGAPYLGWSFWNKEEIDFLRISHTAMPLLLDVADAVKALSFINIRGIKSVECSLVNREERMKLAETLFALEIQDERT